MATRQRTCLKCNKLFASAGPANRICRHCQQVNARLPQLTEAQLQKQRGAKRHNGVLLEPSAADEGSF